VDIGKNDQGWAFLVRGNTPPKTDEDDPTIMAVGATTVGVEHGACKATSK
jgi:hypothetical protein